MIRLSRTHESIKREEVVRVDELMAAVAQSLTHAGPEYVTALGLVAIGAWVVAKALPLYASHQDKRLGIEQQREQRKAAEEASREQRDRERSETESAARWKGGGSRNTSTPPTSKSRPTR